MIAIKTLAARKENIVVARVSLANMHQDGNETIRSFGARIKGQAGMCKYVMQCPSCITDVTYTDHIHKDVVCRGVADPDIQLDLLVIRTRRKSLVRD